MQKVGGERGREVGRTGEGRKGGEKRKGKATIEYEKKKKPQRKKRQKEVDTRGR